MSVVLLAIWSAGCVALGGSVVGWWSAWRTARGVDRAYYLARSAERDAQGLAEDGDREAGARAWAYSRGVRHGALSLLRPR